jgi:hypothetical protein
MTIQEMTRKGGKASAKKRLGGKTQSEISQIMRRVRLSKVQETKFKQSVQEVVNNLNKNVKNEQTD